MARIRTIKPEFFTDAKITGLTPLARLFYVSLWCEADREGRLAWEPETLKYRYLPADKCSVEKLAGELLDRKLIRLYTVGDKNYCDVPAFSKNQVINNREQQSSIPAYSDDAWATRESGVKVAAYGKEGRKGREGKEGTTPVAPKGDGSFEKFWEAYPEKVGKKSAERAWDKATDKPDLPSILASIDRYVRTKPSDRAYCHPATWLNEGRWNDAPASTVVPMQSADPEDSRWKMRLVGWVSRKVWHRDLWGPAPDEPDCKAPKGLLQSIPTASERALSA